MTGAATPTGGRPWRDRLRSWRWPIAVAAVVSLAGLGTAVLVPTGTHGDLDPRAYGATGSHAVVQVLRDRGVTVTLVERSTDAARQATGGSTLLVAHPELIGPEQLRRLQGTGADLVLVHPDLTVLDALAPAVVPAGASHARLLSPACADPDAVAAGRVTGTGGLYRIQDTTGPTPVRCYPGDSDAGTFGLIRVTSNGRQVSVLGQGDVLRNRTLTATGTGNAALAFRLLGAHPQLTWYLPDPAELAASDDRPTLGQLLPRWVSWVLWQLVIVAVLAMFWRGRRLGRLVKEPLPVVVRSAETHEGRARLYRQARARGLAAATLRTAAVRRLAVRLGVPARSEPQDVVRSVAAAIDGDETAIRETLLGRPPSNDAALVRLAAELDVLEHRLDPRTHPNQPVPQHPAQEAGTR